MAKRNTPQWNRQLKFIRIINLFFSIIYSLWYALSHHYVSQKYIYVKRLSISMMMSGNYIFHYYSSSFFLTIIMTNDVYYTISHTYIRKFPIDLPSEDRPANRQSVSKWLILIQLMETTTIPECTMETLLLSFQQFGSPPCM